MYFNTMSIRFIIFTCNSIFFWVWIGLNWSPSDKVFEQLSCSRSLVHRNEMAGIVNCSQFIQSSWFSVASSFSIDFPNTEQFVSDIRKKIPKLLSLIKMNSLGPLKSTGSFYNQIVLTIVNHDFAFSSEDFFNEMNVWHHEIFIHGFVNMAWLASELNVPPQSKKSLHIIIPKILIDY